MIKKKNVWEGEKRNFKLKALVKYVAQNSGKRRAVESTEVGAEPRSPVGLFTLPGVSLKKLLSDLTLKSSCSASVLMKAFYFLISVWRVDFAHLAFVVTQFCCAILYW